MRLDLTFKQFRNLMQRRKHTVDDLVALFRGKIDDPREFFERVMSCRWHHEDRSDVVIPYCSVILFYEQELSFVKDLEDAEASRAVNRRRALSPERRQALRERMSKVRAMRKSTPRTREIIEEVIKDTG